MIETSYDLRGRTTYRRVTTLASGFDGSVRRIGTGYTTRGQVELVTQYDNATVGSGSVVDEVKYTYDDWGNVTTFEQDRDGAVGGGGNQYTVGYTWAKATPSGGHDTLRCTGMTLPGTGDSSTIIYTYDSAANVLDDAASRVTKLQTGSGPTTRATYKYLGTAHLVGTDVIEPDVYSRLYGSGTANYDAVDRFNRTTVSRWTKNISPPRNFYDVTLTYDRASNITSTDDAVLAGFDAAYTMDSRNRLTRADEGTLSGGSITGRTRDQQWTLSQPGNWIRNKLDLDGDGAFTSGGELDDTGTFNTVNELTARDIDTSGGNDYTLTYDAVGNLTNDGEDYKYVYDAFGRMVTVKNRSNDAVVAEYSYNGLNHRKSWHYDTDTDGDVDASDKTYRFAYDTRWRMVATFRDADSNPKERFVWQNAGLNGRGGSSYIDSAVLRDRDMTSGWTGSADGTLEQRHYYCQNWRADVSVVLKYEDSVWRVAEWIKYSAYGVPFSITPADFDNTGFVDIDDDTAFDTAYNGGAGSWSARVDLDLDGSLTSADEDIFDSEFIGGENGGRHVLSRESVANRLGYAGYQYDPTFVGAERSLYHVRHRVYDAGSGRWTRRDPIEYVGSRSKNLVEYANFNPVRKFDPSGLIPCTSCTANAPVRRQPEQPPDLPEPLDLKQCSDCLDGCFASNDKYEAIVRKLLACKESHPEFQMVLPSCKEGGPGGSGYDCKAHTLRINPGAVSSCEQVCRVAIHELSHELDDCEAGGNCAYNKGDLGIRCDKQACSEAKAYNVGGQCCKNSGWRYVNETYCDCMSRLTTGSLRMWHNGECPNPKEYADAAIGRESCYDPAQSYCPEEAEVCILPR